MSLFHVYVLPIITATAIARCFATSFCLTSQHILPIHFFFFTFEEVCISLFMIRLPTKNKHINEGWTQDAFLVNSLHCFSIDRKAIGYIN